MTIKTLSFIEEKIQDNINVKKSILENNNLKHNILLASELIITCFNRGHAVLLCGNGGSAADAQHIAAELHGRFKMNRRPIPAVALSTNASSITAIGNDISFEDVFLRQLQGFAHEEDILISISTSGRSENVVRAMRYARDNKIKNIALTGESGGSMKEFSDVLINIPSKDTARIQESHILIGHIICEIVETELFKHLK